VLRLWSATPPAPEREQFVLEDPEVLQGPVLPRDRLLPTRLEGLAVIEAAPIESDEGRKPWMCWRKRRGGGFCRAKKLKGIDTCRKHGGLGGRPIIHGRYSKKLGVLGPAYDESIADPNLLDLREPIAVMDALAKRLMERTSEGDTPEMRRRAMKLLAEARAARADDRNTEADSKLDALADLLRDGISEDRAAAALVETLDRLARRIESFEHLKLARKNAVNGKDLVLLYKRFLELAQEYMPKDSWYQFAVVVNSKFMKGSGSAELKKIADRESRVA
jgi:hypothetical protein